MPGFYDYFKENMDALGMPVPDSLFGTAGAAAAAGVAISELAERYGQNVTFGDLIGAGKIADHFRVLNGVVVAAYAGAVVGSLAVALGRTLANGTSIADVLWDLWGAERPTTPPEWWPTSVEYDSDATDDIAYYECVIEYEDPWTIIWHHTNYNHSGQIIDEYDHIEPGREGSASRIGLNIPGSLTEALGTDTDAHGHKGHSHPTPNGKPKDPPLEPRAPLTPATSEQTTVSSSGFQTNFTAVGSLLAGNLTQSMTQFTQAGATSIQGSASDIACTHAKNQLLTSTVTL